MPLTWNTTKIKDELAWYKVPSEQLNKNKKKNYLKNIALLFLEKQEKKEVMIFTK